MTFGFREGVSTFDIRRSTDELDLDDDEDNGRPVFVQRRHQAAGDRVGRAGSESGASSTHSSVIRQRPGSKQHGPFQNRNFRMIDASLTDLTQRRESATSFTSIQNEMSTPGRKTPTPSITSASTIRSGKFMTTNLIETSFCGPKPIPAQSFDAAGIETLVPSSATTPSGSIASPRTKAGYGGITGIDPQQEIVSLSGSEDLSMERNLVEEINRRTGQFPLTKQDSYANAIYSSAAARQQRRLRKQGSYEAAVESGVKKQAAMKRTKQILQIRKQDSYTRAIGGSFEDDPTGEERGLSASQRAASQGPSPRMPRKQESYLMAVGEMSPEFETPAVEITEMESSPIHRIRKQDSYLKAVDGLSPEDELAPLPSTPRISIRKQDSYQRAILGSSLGSSFGDSNDGSFERPNVLLTRQEAMEKTSPRPSPRVSPKRSVSPKIGDQQRKRAGVKKQDSYSKAIEIGYTNNNNSNIDNRGMGRFSNYDQVLREFKEKAPVSGPGNFQQVGEAAVTIQSAFKGYKTRKEIQEIQTFYKQVSESDDRYTVSRGNSTTRQPVEPLSIKKRQDSYLQAVGISPEEEVKTNQRSWKIRQDSYQQAIERYELSLKILFKQADMTTFVFQV